MWAVYSLALWYLSAEQIKTSWHFLWVLMNHNHTQVQQQQTVFACVLFLLIFSIYLFFSLDVLFAWLLNINPALSQQYFPPSPWTPSYLIPLSFCLQNPPPQPQPVRSNTWTGPVKVLGNDVGHTVGCDLSLIYLSLLLFVWLGLNTSTQ